MQNNVPFHPGRSYVEKVGMEQGCIDDGLMAWLTAGLDLAASGPEADTYP